VQAETLATRCAAEHDEADCSSARELYRDAADAWNTLIVGRPDDASVGDWTVQRAQALLAGGSLAEAATAAKQYLTASTDDALRRTAAEVLVSARQRALEAAGIEVRQAPPDPEGEPPEVRPIGLPWAVALLIEARARYLEVVPVVTDTVTTRRAYALDNALLLYRYGHWTEARRALQEVFDAGCAGESARGGAAAAWRTLRDIAVSLGRYDTVAELGRVIGERGCDFGEPGTPTCGDLADDPRCIAQTDAVSVRLRTGMVLAQRAERTQGEERVRSAIRAGETFLASVDDDPSVTPIDRVAGLTLAARAFRLGNSERAVEVDRRITTEVVPSRFAAEERTRALTALADALERLLALAHEAARHEEVVTFATRLLGPDFDVPELADARATARAELPVSLVALGRHREASEAWAALATAATEPAQQRSAALSSALELSTANDCRRATVALRAFARAHRGEAGAGDEVVRALYAYALCQRAGSSARTAALDDMTAAATETRDALTPEARGYVAAAAFARADAGFDALAGVRITIPRVPNSEALVAGLTQALSAPADQVRQLLEGYDGVARINDPRWAVAAHYRAGLAIERLADAVLAAAWSDPQDLEAERRSLTTASYDRLRAIIVLRVRAVVEAQALPLRCRAVERFDRIQVIATQMNVQSPEVEGARARLAAIDGAIATRCRAQRPGAAH
jgi:hypothetical protein